MSATKSGCVSKNNQRSPPLSRASVPWLPSRSRSRTRTPVPSQATGCKRVVAPSGTASRLSLGTWPRTKAAIAATSAFAKAKRRFDRGERDVRGSSSPQPVMTAGADSFALGGDETLVDATGAIASPVSNFRRRDHHDWSS